MRQESLTSLLARWEEALEQGRELTPEELCADRPELMDAMRDGIEAARRMRFLGSNGSNRSTLDRNATIPPLPDTFRPDAAVGMASPPGYEILGELGRGGMGVVYRARQIGLNRVVALKMILSGGHAGVDERMRFLAEGESIAKVRHPGIVQVHDFGMHGGMPFFSLEFCEGGSLADKLNGTPLPPREAAELVERVSRAVHAAHEAGIVHRDLKPHNVLLGADGSPRVTDFGLAKRVEGGGHTQTGAVMGTPSYMAPEQAQGKKDVGPLADVYALGAILYECLSGRPPFRAATAYDTILQVVADEPVTLRRLNAKVPADLETICHRCLQKDPSKRYASAEALADDLQRYLDGRPITARPVGRFERFVRWCRREPVVAGLLGALALGATVSGMLAVRAEHKATEAEEYAEEAFKKERQANKEKARADENARDALRQKEQADEQRDRAERLVYAGKLALAQRAWQDNYPREALHLLSECQWNLRGWEHSHLWTLYTSSQVTMNGHASEVTSVAFGPDGKRIVSRSTDGVLKVWNAENGSEMLTLSINNDPITRVAYSPEGKRIVVSSVGKSLKILDAESGRKIFTLKGHTAPVAAMAWSPDGKRIATIAGGLLNEQLRRAPFEVKIWDVQKEQEAFAYTWNNDFDILNSLAFSPDSQRIVIGGLFQTEEPHCEMLIIDATMGQTLLKMPVPNRARSPVCSVTYSPDGKYIASGSRNHMVRVWDAEKGLELISFKGHTDFVESVAYSPDGRRIVSASGDKTVRVWDVEDKEEAFTLKGHTGNVVSVAYSPDGKRIVSGSWDTTVRLWDAEKGQEALTFGGGRKSIRSIAFRSDGKRIVSGGFGSLIVWDAERGEEVLALFKEDGFGTRFHSVAYSPDGKRIVSGCGTDSFVRGKPNPCDLKLWDAETGQALLSLKGHMDQVSSVAYSPDGKQLVSGSFDKTLKLWDTEKGCEIATYKGHTLEVYSVAFSPDGKRIVSGGSTNEDVDRPGEVMVWDVERRQLALTLMGHSGAVRSVAYSPDGKRIVSGSSDKTAKVWDAQNGQELLTLRGNTDTVVCTTYSPDGKRIVSSGGRDKTVKVWDAERGQLLLSFMGHNQGVGQLVFSPDGNRLASGNSDGAVKIWEALKDQEILTLHGHTHTVSAVAFSPDGKFAVSKDVKGNRLAWNITTGQPATAEGFVPPKGQTETCHPARDLLIRADGIDVVLRRLRVNVPGYETNPILKPNFVTWHRGQAADAEQSEQPFSAAFHLERLYNLQPTSAVRERLLAALKQTPDSPAGRNVRDRLLATDAARLAGVVAARNVLAMPPLTAPVPPLVPIVTPPQQPPRMRHAD